MNKLIIFVLTLLPVFSYSQVTSINIDTSASQVIIINNGTMIQNNGGTVNVSTERVNELKVERLPPNVGRYYYSPYNKTHSEDELKDERSDKTGKLVFAFIFFIASVIASALLIKNRIAGVIGDGGLFLLVFTIPISIYCGYYIHLAISN